MPRAPADERERCNWADLCMQARELWITGLRDHALHERLGSSNDGLGAIVVLPGEAARPVTSGESPRDRFDMGGERLLILGAPGSGKTTMLLTLATTLLDAAERDETLPIPVIFSLATWAAGCRPLRVWLVAELVWRYKVPAHLGRVWVERNVILPLLDGLDEVGPTDAERTACWEAITVYLNLYGGPTVLCRGAAAGERQRQHFSVAVELRPLATSQINAYLLVRHIVLRWLLYWRCGAPVDFAAALDDAVSYGLMARTGGGYCFVHQRLQEHFAHNEHSRLPIAPILGSPRPVACAGHQTVRTADRSDTFLTVSSCTFV